MKRVIPDGILLVAAALLMTGIAGAQDSTVAPVAAALEKVIDSFGGACVRMLPVETETVLRHVPWRRSIQFPEAGCYRVAAMAETTDAGLHLALHVDNRVVTENRTAGSQPMIDWCTPGPVNVEIVVTPRTHDTVFALAVLRRNAMATENARSVVGGNDNDMIATRIRQIHALRLPLDRPLTSPLRGSLAPGGTHDFAVNIRSASCISVLAAAEPSLQRLQVSIISPDGSATAASESGLFVMARDICVPSGSYRVRVTAVEGSGQFGVQLFIARPPKKPATR